MVFKVFRLVKRLRALEKNGRFTIYAINDFIDLINIHYKSIMDIEGKNPKSLDNPAVASAIEAHEVNIRELINSLNGIVDEELKTIDMYNDYFASRKDELDKYVSKYPEIGDMVYDMSVTINQKVPTMLKKIFSESPQLFNSAPKLRKVISESVVTVPRKRDMR